MSASESSKSNTAMFSAMSSAARISPDGPEAGGLVEAVLALPPKYRIVVHLYYYEDMSVAEIAALLGKSQGGVKSRLFRARALLRKWMEADEDVRHGL